MTRHETVAFSAWLQAAMPPECPATFLLDKKIRRFHPARHGLALI
ncbi:MAG TPA: hypothetical protein VF797_21585 [Noviherbaspirillum sp.]